MKTLKFLPVACIFIVASCQPLLQRTTAGQSVQPACERYIKTEDGGHRYLVKQVNKVIDGDTFDATLLCTDTALGTNIRVRIMRINCPELRAKCEEEQEKALMAREALRLLLSNAKQIEVVLYPKDNYDRYLGDVYVDSQSAADILLEKGLAKPYFGKGKKPRWCK